ncbi:hypothetical protein HFP51_12070 [Parasphingopyxis sp. CP4]|jgi:hypothetical protein|uniref:hypothetical protein n=1 Tax=Parasphingopyxis sp. CP4 TaxID=2724527 RepID=UPI0015A4E22E|nr:hypothetical protein [Parasphingopyxis sp. CP4]QLC22853.1 hypothetical protein HFP51_12070 [Parasphingopyxis sp. CP4]
MLNIVSLLIGLVAAVMALVGLIPLLGWVNWLMLPVAFVGLVVGMLSDSNLGRNLCIVVAIVGGLRLMLGGGFI